MEAGAGYYDDDDASWMAEQSSPPHLAPPEVATDLARILLDLALRLPASLSATIEIRATHAPIAITDDDDDDYGMGFLGVDGGDIGEDGFAVMGGDESDAYRDGGFGAVPASSDAIASLPEAAMGETREEECAVCLEDFAAGDKLRKMPCSHGFHESCIFGWLRVSRLCPCCRFAMPADEVSEMETDSDTDGDDDDQEEEEEELYAS